MYHCIGKKLEKNLIEDLDQRFPDRWNEEKAPPTLDYILQNAKTTRF